MEVIYYMGYMFKGEARDVVLDSEIILRIKGQIYVPRVDNLTRLIMKKAYN